MSENLYVIGHPVAHSKSPAMYNAVYARMGLPWVYAAKDIAQECEAEEFISAKDYLSINITTPYKPAAYRAASLRSSSARLAKGVNLLIPKADQLIGYNTDGMGCIANLRRLGADFSGSCVVVCGTGPTSLALLHASAVAGSAEVTLLGRDKAKAEKVLRGYVDEFATLAHSAIDLPADGERSFKETFDETTFRYGAYATSRKAIADADIILDATPLGMKPDDPAPFDTSLISRGQWVFDAVYGHGTTSLARAAQDADARFVDGQGMLVGQAVVTVQMVCEVTDTELPFGFDELFDIMSEAAGFAIGTAPQV